MMPLMRPHVLRRGRHGPAPPRVPRLGWRQWAPAAMRLLAREVLGASALLSLGLWLVLIHMGTQHLGPTALAFAWLIPAAVGGLLAVRILDYRESQFAELLALHRVPFPALTASLTLVLAIQTWLVLALGSPPQTRSWPVVWGALFAAIWLMALGRLIGVLSHTAQQCGPIQAASVLLGGAGSWLVLQGQTGIGPLFLLRFHGGTAWAALVVQPAWASLLPLGILAGGGLASLLLTARASTTTFFAATIVAGLWSNLNVSP